MQPGQTTAFPRPFFRTILPIAVLMLALGAHRVYADPVRTVTLGAVGQIPEDGERSWDLLVDGLWLDGDSFEIVPLDALTCGYPCTPGTSMNLSSTMTVGGRGLITSDTTTYDPVYYTGTFRFDAGSVTVPDLGSYHYVEPGPAAPFTFTGTLSAYADPGLAGAPLFSSRLAGRGLVDVSFYGGPGPHEVYADGFDYMFTGAATTPEPASLLLLGTGAAWLCARTGRRQRG